MSNLFKYNGVKIDIELHTPEEYGAKGDGITDDTAAIQQAVNSKYVLFGTGKTYLTTDPICVKNGTFLNLNGAKIKCTDAHVMYNFENGDSYGSYNGNGNITIANGMLEGGCVSFIHGKNILLENIEFTDCLNDHFVEICACSNFRVNNCTFRGMKYTENRKLEYINIDTIASYAAFPHNKSSQNDPVFYDNSVSDRIIVKDCYFTLGEGTYAYGFNAVGAHAGDGNSYTKNVSINNNIIRGFTGCGIRINAMDGVMVSGNDIQSDGDGIRIGDIAHAKNIVICGNYVVCNGTRLVRTNGQYTNLTVANNVTQGDSQDF